MKGHFHIVHKYKDICILLILTLWGNFIDDNWGAFNGLTV